MREVLKPRCHLDIKKCLFSHHIVDIWNSLDDSIIACDSIYGLRIELINVCMVEGLYKLFIRFPFLYTYFTILYCSYLEDELAEDEQDVTMFL
jgi:hypothetical protein